MNPDFHKDVDNPGDGHDVIAYLQQAHGAMTGCRPVTTCEAIESSLEYLSAAVVHGKQSIELGRMSGMMLQQARMFDALLRAAQGTRETESPVVGALTYALRVTELHPDRKTMAD